MEEIVIVKLEHLETGLRQILVVADLVRGGVNVFSRLVEEAGKVDVFYCDPPWTPGVERTMRNRVGVKSSKGFDVFLDTLVESVTRCDPSHVFFEQSWNVVHRTSLLKTVNCSLMWNLPLFETWRVNYGSPSRPNMLLHWGREYLTTDPTCWSGDAMVRHVFEGVELRESGLVVDPCVGSGTTSRVAHYFGQNFVGTDFNAGKLERAVNWLVRHGYRLVS